MGRRFQDALIKLQAIHRLGDYSSVSCGEIGLPEISWQSVNFPELEDGLSPYPHLEPQLPNAAAHAFASHLH